MRWSIAPLPSPLTLRTVVIWKQPAQAHAQT